MKEKYLFELGGENTELGKYEALELLKTKKYEPKLILDNQNVIVIEVSSKIKTIVIERFAMVKRISRIIYYSDEDKIDNILQNIPQIDIGNSSFAIRTIDKKKHSESIIATKLGTKISVQNEINLNEPAIKVLYYAERKSIISIWENKKETYYKRCLKHHIKYRPFFSPIGIHPRIARSMVNLANCSSGQKIIDPFCGTGGILIEIENMKIQSIGIDVVSKMKEYSEGNLKYFNLTSNVIKGDIERINEFDIDAIVTDPPYGMSTTTKGEGVKDLMKRSMLLFSQKLEKKQRLIMAISNPKLVKNSDFNILYQFEWYIHKSLTRYIVVMEKN